MARKTTPARQRTPGPVEVLHRDAGLVVVAKPAGLVTEPTRDPARPSVVSVLRAQLARPNDAMVQVPHRLDRDTSGVLLVALQPSVLRSLNEAFARRSVRKVYLAVVHGTLAQDEGVWESFLAAGPRQRGRARWASVRAGGGKAITRFFVRARASDRTVVECHPETGRTHQLRVHLSEAGHPIVGDEFYGAPVGDHAHHGRHLLHAWRLSIPGADEAMRTFEAPAPPAFRLDGDRY